MAVKIQGWDISLNHSAFVELVDGEFTNAWFITTKINWHKKFKNSYFLDKLDSKQHVSHKVAIDRYNKLSDIFISHILKTEPDYICLEDYAHGANRQAHQIGEVGGLARSVIYNQKIPLRMHEPTTPKLFMAHNGNADKDKMEDAVKERFNLGFREYDPPSKAKKPNRDVSGDMVDAFSMAHCLYAEMQVRLGLKEVKDFHPKEIQMFNRVTKAYPTNLLDRDLVFIGDEVKYTL